MCCINSPLWIILAKLGMCSLSLHYRLFICLLINYCILVNHLFIVQTAVLQLFSDILQTFMIQNFFVCLFHIRTAFDTKLHLILLLCFKGSTGNWSLNSVFNSSDINQINQCRKIITFFNINYWIIVTDIKMEVE